MSFKNWSLTKVLPYLLTVCGVIGVYCSFVLSQDKIRLLEDPDAILSCSIDPILACGNVIMTDQATAFGFPNPFLGLIGFTVMLTVGVAILAGAKFKKWFWLAMQAGLLFALGFVHWLFYQTVYNIDALCIYCIAVWIITITSLWYISLYNIDQKHIKLPKGKLQTVYHWIRKHHLDILILWFIILTALVLNHFWYYYGTKF